MFLRHKGTRNGQCGDFTEEREASDSCLLCLCLALDIWCIHMRYKYIHRVISWLVPGCSRESVISVNKEYLISHSSTIVLFLFCFYFPFPKPLLSSSSHQYAFHHMWLHPPFPLSLLVSPSKTLTSPTHSFGSHSENRLTFYKSVDLFTRQLWHSLREKVRVLGRDVCHWPGDVWRQETRCTQSLLC